MKSLRYIALVMGISVGTASVFAHGTIPVHCFDNTDVARLVSLSNAKPQLVYVWSSRVVLSVEQLEVAARMAAVNGMDFTALQDVQPIAFKPAGYGYVQRGSAPSQNAPPVVVATPPFFPILDSSQALCAPTLLNRDAFRHFPSAFVIAKGSIHPHPIVGAMPDAAWQQSIAERLAQ